MKLPHGDWAAVPQHKVTRYLLSLDHPEGGSKARYFRGLGFHGSDPALLIEALRQIALDGEVRETVGSRFGRKYVVAGVMQTPIGRLVTIRTVWIVLKGEETPRFVTAYPEGTA